MAKQKDNRIRRKASIRKKLSGTPERPRLSVFRSAKHMYAQVVDDVSGTTLASASTLAKDIEASGTKSTRPRPSERRSPTVARTRASTPSSSTATASFTTGASRRSLTRPARPD